MRNALCTFGMLLLPLIALGDEFKLLVSFENEKTGKPARIVVNGLSDAALNANKERKPDSPAWSPLAQVKVAGGTAQELSERPALLGSWHVDGKRLLFEPRFPFLDGMTFCVIIDPLRLADPDSKQSKLLEFNLSTPKKDLTPVTKVAHIYPTRSRLPENQLRFYIEFSKPMSRGDAYKHIQFLNAKGKPINDVFVEIDEELWDPTMTRFTLLFDPGRIKKGLKPREDLGPTMEDGKRYTLVVFGTWNDGEGRQLTQKEFRKEIIAGPPDDEPIDEKKWKIVTPVVGTKNPCQVRFPEPLDFALLHRVIWIVDDKGKKIAGNVKVEDEETLWKLTPEQPWAAGKYRLVADSVLEDLAANQIGRPFEVDVFRPIPKKFEAKLVEVPFEIKSVASVPSK